MPYKLKKGLYPYPLSYLNSIGCTDPTDFIAGDPTVLPNSTNWYVFCLTPDQLQAFRNIVNVGAPIVYPDSYSQWLQAWSQLEQFPNEIPDNSCMDLCQLILECIQTTPALQQEIASLAVATPLPLDSEADSTILATDLISDTTNCDDDKLFGAITGLVDLLNNLAVDFIERMQDAPNTIARVAELIEVIPGVGEIIPADLLTLVENFVEDMQNLYASAYTVALRDEYRCDLFCLSRDDCNIDFQGAIDYFAGKVTGGIQLDEWSDFIGQYVTGSFTGESLVAAWHVWCLGIMAYGTEVLDIDEAQLIRMVSALFNDPDSDWSTLCACANTWSATLDFTTSDFGVVWLQDDNTDDIGQWINGVGFQATSNVYSGVNKKWMRGTINFDATQITSIQAIGTFESGYNAQPTLTALNNEIFNGGVNQGFSTRLNYSDFTIGVSTPVDVSDSGDAPADALIFTWRPDNNGFSGGATLTSIVLEGTGTKPSQFP